MSENRLHRAVAVLALLATLTLSAVPALARTGRSGPQPARVPARVVADFGAWTGIFARLWDFFAGAGQEKEGSSIDPHGTPNPNNGSSAAGEEGIFIDPHG